MVDHILKNANLIKAGRNLLNWHQKDLAKHTGLSVTTIRNIEASYNNPNLSTLINISKAFENHGISFKKTGSVIHISFDASISSI